MPIKYDKMQYIYPPRPDSECKYQSELFNELRAIPGWIAEVKANGQRNTIYIDPEGNVSWWNRKKQYHKNYLVPQWLNDEILRTFNVQRGKWSVIDGELLHNKDSSVKDTIYFWDLLVLNGEYMIGETLANRKAKLFEITVGLAEAPSVDSIKRVTPNLWIAETIQPENWDLWPELTKQSWIEGFVLKNTRAELEFGLRVENNQAWQIRCRKLSRSGHVGKYG